EAVEVGHPDAADGEDVGSGTRAGRPDRYLDVHVEPVPPERYRVRVHSGRWRVPGQYRADPAEDRLVARSRVGGQVHRQHGRVAEPVLGQVRDVVYRYRGGTEVGQRAVGVAEVAPERDVLGA